MTKTLATLLAAAFVAGSASMALADQKDSDQIRSFGPVVQAPGTTKYIDNRAGAVKGFSAGEKALFERTSGGEHAGH